MNPPPSSPAEMTSGPAAAPAPLDPERARAFLHQAARRVAETCQREMNRRGPGVGDEVGMGADGTPTKFIDKVAEDVILETLNDADLPLNVLSEEAGFIDRGGDHTLVIDPIDGTRNATHGIPFYCTSLAIGTRSLEDIEYALIRNLATDDFYWARRGHGATVNGETVRVRPGQPDDIVLAAVSDEFSLLEGYWNDPRIHLRDMGSCALEMALVATGSFDAFVCPFPFLRVIDIAAATLIVREAGGEVYTPTGERLDVPFDLTERAAVLAVAREDLLGVLL